MLSITRDRSNHNGNETERSTTTATSATAATTATTTGDDNFYDNHFHNKNSFYKAKC